VSVKTSSALEWVAIVVVSLLIAAGAIALLSGYFAGQDAAGVSGSSNGPGLAFRDVGNGRLKPGQRPPHYNTNPPTSGPHRPVAVRRNAALLSNQQLLQALSLGDVVLMYGTPAPPPGLRPLAVNVAGPFTPALAATGQAVILARRPGVPGVLGLAWTRLIRVAKPSDPALRQFAQYWLGRGASGR
jgi:hypothetical protein